jgi:hypothetical protein
MARLTLLVLAGVCVACARDDGPTKMTAPNGGNYTSAVNNRGEGGALNSDDAHAQVLIEHVHAKFRECDGADGQHYVESKNVFTGVSTGDPRLSGAFEFAMIHDLLNVTKSNGPDIANITIRDPSTGRVKAEGRFNSWGRDDWLQGTIVGVVRDEGGGSELTTGSGNWIANLHVRFAPGRIIMDVGGTTVPGNQPAAGIFSGGCPGERYTEVDFDLPPSNAISISAAAATDAWRRRAGM